VLVLPTPEVDASSHASLAKAGAQQVDDFVDILVAATADLPIT
jgi:hypothetical protein